MAVYFRVELGENAVEYKKTDSGMLEQTLFSVRQSDQLADVKFFLRGKPVTLERMAEEIDNIRDAWFEKKNKTHKQISVIDGVSGLKRKKIWVRK